MPKALNYLAWFVSCFLMLLYFIYYWAQMEDVNEVKIAVQFFISKKVIRKCFCHVLILVRCFLAWETKPQII